MRNLFLVFLFVLMSTFFASAQTIPVMNFKQFEPMLHYENDTTYVINFWATWCRPCVKELPYFEDLTKNYSDEKLKVILVSFDLAVQRVLLFAEDNKLKSQVIYLDDPDSNEWIPKVHPEWSGAIPATVIYNKNERLFFEGELSQNKLNSTVKKLIKNQTD